MENPIPKEQSQPDVPLVAGRIDQHRIREAVVQLLDDLDQPEPVRRREVAEVPFAEELMHEERDEPTRHEMIDLPW